MVTIGYCTRVSNEDFGKHLIKSCGLDPKKVEVIEIVNTGNRSLTECYNEILKKAKYDYVVFTHSDLTIETKQWGNKLLKQFTKNPEYGIIGVAGTKNMPVSGQWWEDRKRMIGRVAHTHEGKTWLSSYSDDQGVELEEVVIVDGVFFAVDKTKIKTNFNETVEGFHFYEITFCFENYLKGVKVGVSTLIRVNHKSIGQTNESWEKNRQIFSENFKENLPITIKKVLRKGQKLRVLIGCLAFKGHTQEDTDVLDLIKELIKKDCDVSVVSNIEKRMFNTLKTLGVKMYSLNEPPGFKLGDGKWFLKNADGNDNQSQPNTLYKLGDFNYDVLHLISKPVIDHISRLFPDTNIISTINDNNDNVDEPVISERVKKYIVKNDKSKNSLIQDYGINSDLIEVTKDSDKIIDEYKLLLS